MQEFTQQVIDIILAIPEGKVQTYGGIAKMAGSPRAARQVTRILHSMSRKYGLPWHRIVNSKGQIAIKDPDGAEEQKFRLIKEGVEVSEKYRIDLKKYLWEV